MTVPIQKVVDHCVSLPGNGQRLETLLRAGERCAQSISNHDGSDCPPTCERANAYAEWEAAKKAILE